ncbi:MAG: hypothetical protein AB7S26_16565 [Sandaracinaceae bacterium]
MDDTRRAPHSARLARLLGAAGLAAALALSSASIAAAQEGRRITIDQPHQGGRPLLLDVYGGFSWWGYGFVSGARFGIPIVNNGFVDSINNAVYINFGVDFHFARTCGIYDNGPGCGEYGPGVGFPVTLHWEFYLNETWSVFAEVGGQFFLHPAFIRTGRFDPYDWGWWFIFQVGGTLHIADWFALTLRVGNPYAVFGVQFLFGG